MGVHDIVILDPMINRSQGGAGNRYWTDSGIVRSTLYKRLRHAVAFPAFDRGEVRGEVEHQRHLDGVVCGEDRAMIVKPAHRVVRGGVPKRFSAR